MRIILQRIYIFFMMLFCRNKELKRAIRKVNDKNKNAFFIYSILDYQRRKKNVTPIQLQALARLSNG
jgi:hypothetical protein